MSQFSAVFGKSSSFGKKMFTFTNLGAKFVRTSLSHSIIVFLSILSGDLDLLSFLTMELYEEPELCNVVRVQYCIVGIWFPP